MQYDITECGKRIRRSREKKGLTQKQAASLLGIRNTSLCSVENGCRAASIDLLIDMSKLFDVSLDYLILGRPSNMREDLGHEVSEMMVHMMNIMSILSIEPFNSNA